MVFSYPEDLRLKCYREISDWLQNDWCPHMKESPINKSANQANKVDKIINPTIMTQPFLCTIHAKSQ